MRRTFIILACCLALNAQAPRRLPPNYVPSGKNWINLFYGFFDTNSIKQIGPNTVQINCFFYVDNTITFEAREINLNTQKFRSISGFNYYDRATGDKTFTMPARSSWKHIRNDEMMFSLYHKIKPYLYQ